MAGVAFNEAGRRARRHGRGRGGLRRLGPPEPGHRQLLERDDGAVLERRQRAVHRRGAGVDDRPRVAAAPDVRLLLLRRRSRRAARHLRAPTATSPTTSPRVQPTITLRAAAAPVPQSRREEVRGRHAPASGAAFATPVVGRGAAYGDYDNDGDLDLLITANNGPARLLRNDGGVEPRAARHARGHGVEPRRASARRVRVDSREQGRPLVAHGEDRLELPVAERAAADVRPGRRDEGRPASRSTWPNGKTERLAGVAADQAITIQEGQGRRRRPRRSERSREDRRRRARRRPGDRSAAGRIASDRAPAPGQATAPDREARLARQQPRRGAARTVRLRRGGASRFREALRLAPDLDARPAEPRHRAVLRRPHGRGGGGGARGGRAPARHARARTTCSA